MARHGYLVALGSNMRHQELGSPRAVLEAALRELDRGPLERLARSRIHTTAPLGPSRRRFANAAAVVRTALDPEALLRRLKRIERDFGRKARGQSWRARVLDLDIVLWTGGTWASPALTIPHRAYRQRRFVLDPACEVAPEWRDPLSGLTTRHLRARLTKPRPAPR
ncbi:2-amino-4-hydroxy-6-hydroxymethyldihydropteridine diphosphokinase [Novosphingobium sp. PC22D]|uniref:2-amino-4-hydroxy-6- hydroxymethyldihydropteridine diphosphokinase n=1 Tax=Novosphingobium sp. PC22D TaxID=1962403 RepID=UPI000BF141A1|nr:2-amino-4-hydroxy-6-hydroxymethyldihydropteridine diphosphokinase [Novosphingobium sp. PC22D]PEQ12039.1 2-amino-4-hydroxy-6-hydroxymethyldihydropteridine diphosphokinase [Novosphingobium sp. PC22D]